MTPVKKVCVITGGTSGIGLCTAQAMLEKGYTVYELSRRAEGAPGMKHIMADVTKEETLAAAVQEILKQEDHIDGSSTTRASAFPARSNSRRRRTRSTSWT